MKTNRVVVAKVIACIVATSYLPNQLGSAPVARPSSWGGDAYLDRKRLKTFFAVRDKLQFMEAFEEMKVGGKVDKNICNLALKFAVHIEDKGLAACYFVMIVKNKKSRCKGHHQ